MGIIVRLDRVMSNRKIKLLDLAEKIGITYANLSNLKNGKVNAIRFSTLENICKELNCQPGDILEYLDDDIIKYIESFAKSDIEKEGALNRLYAYAKIKGEKNLSLELTKKCFEFNKKIDINKIISTIILYFKITHEELISGNRREEVVIARQMALYLCRTETTESLKEICEYFNIDSNSFIFACDKISENLKENKKIQNDYDNIMKILKEE